MTPDPTAISRLSNAWKALFLAAVVILVAMLAATSFNYGDVQTATSAEEFRTAFPFDQRTRYTVAGVLDLFFAAAYALLAVSLAWRIDGSRRVQAVTARAASGLVVAGAALDEVENLRLLRNIADYRSVNDEAVRAMSGLGPVKWALGVGGAVVVLVCLAAARRSSTDGQGGPGMGLTTAASFVPNRARAIGQSKRRAVMALLVGLIVGLVAYLVFGRPELRDALLAGARVQVYVWLLRIVWNAEISSVAYHPWRPQYERIRRATAVVVPVGAIALAFFFWLGRDNHGVAVYIAGVGIYVAVGIVVRRWREHPGRDPHWGPRIVLATTLLGVASLLIATVNLSWGPMAGAVVAVLVFPIGLALIAADAAKTEGGPAHVAWGVAAAAAGMAGLAFAGIGSYQLLLLAAGLAVIVGLIASNTSHDVVLVLLAIALIWSLEPQRGPVEPDPRRGKPVIVAMGDSYISGEGARTYFRGTNHNYGDDDRNECRRAPTAYPVRVRQLLAGRGEEYDLLFLACSGAKAKQLTTDAQYSGEPTSPWSDRGGDRGPDGLPQLQQAIEAIETLDLRPEIVLINIGGNDAGFGEIGQTCGLAGDCSVLGERWLEGLETTRARVRTAYEQIASADALEGARVLVVPYPVPLNESGCGGSLLRPNEHRFVVGFARALDRVLEEEARAAGLDYLARGVDVFTRQRRRICDVQPSEAAVNQLAASPVAGVFLQQVSPRGWFHNTFHPNHRGHELIAREVADWVSPPSERPRQPAPSDAPRLLGGIMGAGFDHCGSPDRVPATCHTNRAAWMVSALTRLLWGILVPVALIVVGALLLSIEAMRRWPRRREGDEGPPPPEAGAVGEESAPSTVETNAE